MADDSDHRGMLLRRFDLCAADFTGDCVERARAGGAIAAADLDILWRLAGAIARSLAEWAALAGGLDLARQGHFDPVASGEFIIEVCFDPVLEPQACRVLAAAVALAQ